MMKERNKKLKAIEKELAIKHVTKKGPVNKFSHVKGKLPKTPKSVKRRKDLAPVELVEYLVNVWEIERVPATDLVKSPVVHA